MTVDYNEITQVVTSIIATVFDVVLLLEQAPGTWKEAIVLPNVFLHSYLQGLQKQFFCT